MGNAKLEVIANIDAMVLYHYIEITSIILTAYTVSVAAVYWHPA